MISNAVSAPSLNCFEFWLNRYQTAWAALAVGVLTLIAGSFAYFAAQSQIKHAEVLEEKRRQAEENAARAGLSLALDNVLEYAKNCSEIFKLRLSNTKDAAPIKLPRFPIGVVEPLQKSIRFADHVNARKISEVLLFSQAFKARIHSGEPWTEVVLYERIKDSAILDVLAGELLAYARGGDGSWIKTPPPIKIGRSIRGLLGREIP